MHASADFVSVMVAYSDCNKVNKSINYLDLSINKEVKQSHYRPGQVQRVQRN